MLTFCERHKYMIPKSFTNLGKNYLTEKTVKRRFSLTSGDSLRIRKPKVSLYVLYSKCLFC